MNTPIKRLSGKTLTLLTVMLAAILGACALSLTPFSAQNEAWADSDEKPLFTTGDITKLPFEKSKDGFTVEVSAADEGGSISASLVNSDQQADSNADAASSDDKANSSSDQAAGSKLTIKVSVKKDTDAGRIVIAADGKKVTKDIKDGKLKEKDPLVISISNCKKIESVSIYAEKSAANGADTNSNTADSASSNDSSSGKDDSAKDASAGNDGNDAPSIVPLSDEGDAKDDSSKSEGVTGTSEGDTSHAPLREVTFDGSSEDVGSWVVYVTSGSPFGEGVTSDGNIVKGINEFELVKDGYVFVGWTDGSGKVIDDSTVINDNITVTPQFTPIEGAPALASEPPRAAKGIVVTFDGSSASLGTWDVTVEAGRDFIEAKDTDGNPVGGIAAYELASDGLTFEGWFDEDGQLLTDATPINQSFTVTPKFTSNDGADVPATTSVDTVVVSFDANGRGTAPAKIELTAGDTVNLDSIDLGTIGSYMFTGWYEDKKCTKPFDSANTPINQDITLYAQWTHLCTVTFDLGEHGSSQEAITVAEGSVIPQFPAPTEEGWTFERWLQDNDETFIPGQTPVNQDMTVHAVWVENIPTDESQSIVVSRETAEAETFNIVVTKVNIDNGKCLEGAEFVLKDKAGNEIGSWTSHNAGVMIEKLRRDTTYVLYETAAPAGFGVEKPINIKFTEENGEAVVRIDQGGTSVPLTNNNDGIASLNVKDTAGKQKTVGTTMPQTGDSSTLPIAIACLAGAAAIAVGIGIVAWRKKK